MSTAIQSLRQFRTQLADDRRGRSGRSQHVRRQPQLRQHLASPIARVAIDHLAGRRDRGFDRPLATQPVVKQIGNEQQRLCRGKRAGIGFFVRVERVQRIERHELDAGRLIDPIVAEFREDLFVGGRVSRIAISVRRADQLAGLVHQRPIDAPRIDANRNEFDAIRLRPSGRLPQADDDFSPNAGNIPMQTRRQPNRTRAETGETLPAATVRFPERRRSRGPIRRRNRWRYSLSSCRLS